MTTDSLMRQLMQVQSRLNEIESLAKIGSWQMSASGNLDWSNEFGNIFSFSPLMNHRDSKSVLNRIHFADRFQWDLLLNKCLLDGEPGEINVRLLDDMMNVKWIKLTCRGVFEDGVICGIHGFCIDITERRNLEIHFDLTRDLLKA